jgi:hypothetical protein
MSKLMPCYVWLGPAAEWNGSFISLPGIYASARKARIGNVPGYYRSSLAGLGYRGSAFFLILMREMRVQEVMSVGPLGLGSFLNFPFRRALARLQGKEALSN